MEHGDEHQYLEERRQGIYDALVRYNPALAGVYRMTIRIYITPAVVGEEQARVAMIAHGMREIVAALPSVLGETSRRRTDDANALGRSLVDLKAQFTEMDLKQELDYVPVPREFALAVDAFVEALTSESAEIREDAAALIAQGTDRDHPAVKQWMKAGRYFPGKAHLRRPPSNDNVPSDEELESYIRIVEDVISARLAGFFDTRRELNGLISNINSEEEDKS